MSLDIKKPILAGHLLLQRQTFLSTATVAKRLGVSTRTIRLWAEQGEIPACKLGRQWRFETGAFLRWLAQHDKSLIEEK